MRAPNNVRELEGIFTQIVAQSQFGRGSVSLPKVENTIERFSQSRNHITLDHIIRITAEKLGFTEQDIKGKKRKARINQARQIAMYLCRELTECSLPKIGEAFGGRSHTTVLHGINKIEEELEFDRVLEQRILKIQKMLSAKTG